MGVVVSSSHIVSAAPSFSGGGLLTLFPCSSMGSRPWETVLHELLQRESFPRAAVLHRLLQRGSPTGSQALPEILLWRGLLSPWVRRSWQEPAPVRVPHRVTASFGHPPALVWGPPRAAGRYLLPCGSTGCRGTACLTMGCRGVSAPVPPPPPSAQTLVSAELPSPTAVAVAPFPPPPAPLLRYPRGATTIADGLSLGLQWVHLGASWPWLCWT